MLNHLMNASAELTLENPFYVKALEAFVWGAFELDRLSGDATSEALGPVGESKAQIIAKESGQFAGLLELTWFLSRLKQEGLKIDMVATIAEGELFEKGRVLFEFSGASAHLLLVERTILNLLQRLCGIATKTHLLQARLPNSIQLLATRKTLWGPLDKRAVALGGGGTHRLHLGDAILVKENHISSAISSAAVLQCCNQSRQHSLRCILSVVFSRSDQVRFVEVELETLEQVQQFVDYAKGQSDLPANLVVMLDNFTLDQIRSAVPLLKTVDVTIEVSGGVNEGNLTDYAIDGVDCISAGMLTNRAHAVDLSMQFV
ncbi:hypothetical protein IPJ72_01130 [Candidatus Peregrinibacteria bacterium]|nr:MAG: hypothetical protein IPJ72_01130 [Candidatus Peregrinibacteria bacterium]